jgi:hypothetical protein
MTIHENTPESGADFHENGTFTDCVKSEKCWCGLKLHLIPYGGREFQNCPLHGSAYKEDAEQKARELAK